jgi:peptide-methionine (R)-S-oxide reductase
MRRPLAALAALSLSLSVGGCSGGPALQAQDRSTEDTERPARFADPPVGERLQLSEAEWRDRLTEAEFHVLREEGTERALTGRFHDHHGHGIYRCAGCGAPLFESEHKFDSGTGWPSFDRPFEGRVREVPDRSLGMTRVEVECARCGGHLGHVFQDGPRQTTGERYCINSISLDFEATER